MAYRIGIKLPTEAHKALVSMARSERRTIRNQLICLVEQGLEHNGYLEGEHEQRQTEKVRVRQPS